MISGLGCVGDVSLVRALARNLGAAPPALSSARRPGHARPQGISPQGYLANSNSLCSGISFASDPHFPAERLLLLAPRLPPHGSMPCGVGPARPTSCSLASIELGSGKDCAMPAIRMRAGARGGRPRSQAAPWNHPSSRRSHGNQTEISFSSRQAVRASITSKTPLSFGSVTSRDVPINGLEVIRYRRPPSPELRFASDASRPADNGSQQLPRPVREHRRTRRSSFDSAALRKAGPAPQAACRAPTWAAGRTCNADGADERRSHGRPAPLGVEGRFPCRVTAGSRLTRAGGAGPDPERVPSWRGFAGSLCRWRRSWR
jgi:hypothetical protein